MASRQFVVFTIDEQEYGIEVLSVSGILRAKKFSLQKVPGLPASIEGIINLRGEVKYLCNLRNKFELAKKPIPAEGKFIMLNANTSAMGWIVDEVTDIVRIEDNELETMPQNINATENNFVESIGKLDERLIIILNAETLSEQGSFSSISSLPTLSA